MRLQHKCLASLVLLCSTQAFGLGLGELHSQSNLGERFKAQIEVFAAPERGTPLSVRLASAEEYQKNGLIYPADLRFKFVTQNEAGQATLLHISSAQTIEEPFIQLLLDVSYPGARVVKAFTVLLDPASASTPVAAVQPVEFVATKTSLAFDAAPPPVALPVVVAAPSSPPPRVLPRPLPRPHPTKVAKPKPTKVAQVPYRSLREQDDARANSTNPSLKLAISTELTTSLRISKLEPHSATTPSSNEDVLQEELIAKNKTLQELTLQITEMQAIINSLKNTAPAASAAQAASAVESSLPVAASGVESNLVAGLSPVIASVSAPVQVKTMRVQAAPETESWWQNPKVLLSLAGVLALAGMAYAWWYRRENHYDSQHNIFDDLHAAQHEAINQDKQTPFAVAPVVVERRELEERRIADTVQIGDVSMKVPAYKAPQATSNPEYDLLEQADIYLQFGHDKLAEEVLQEALIINPKNEQIYLTLLDIYDTRNDVVKFAEFASELEAHADKKIWERVCKMGKRIDPDNELYGLHLAKVAPGEANLHGGHIDHEFGESQIIHPPKH